MVEMKIIYINNSTNYSIITKFAKSSLHWNFVQDYNIHNLHFAGFDLHIQKKA